ncbi:MAG: hypothetical protein AUK47_09545 [Deltaproteobacteria bacterium CG2_30_63_29]|nr:MAG: hypothetical protein AUK47_09545 [Deltaproteobacteria bacterium CG2_30_63_29]PIW00239.1 MAG: hypothetical protein COW42_08430 [Deltaproteobacteria bacterium CG17_big_fil_post_rev_8_21_14_2_50_63_7]PJB45553.1 MAG: hypothetical protein CO108_07165 [Deltaproteobacteria bacterium CG_4_9_14_3_um_filter_63_12]
MTVLNGRYAIEKVFADSGGMGVLYAARDRRCHDNPVLIKTTRYDGGNNSKHFKYTADEAIKHVEKLRKIIEWEKKILVRFKNEAVGNIPSPNDYFTDHSLLLERTHEGRMGAFDLPDALLASEPYLVMERIYGVPLHKALGRAEERDRLEERVLRVAKELLTIFIKFHKTVKLGPGDGYFIYQDLKPANVLLGEGEYVTLIDLGAVTLKMGDRTTEPTAGCITAGYAAPEAAGGRESNIDQRFDLYTLGVTLWQVLTGRDPQELGGEFPQIPLSPLKSLGLSQNTLAFLAKSLERDPERRFQTAAQMRKAAIDVLRSLG